MFCVKCGADIAEDSKFCTTCGKQTGIEFQKKEDKGSKVLWTRRKSILLILLSIILTSIFWAYVYDSYTVSTEDEAVNIMIHLFETVGRQSVAWDKTERMIDLIYYGTSEECLYDSQCADESIATIMSSWAEIEKEKEEIDNLWSKELLFKDVESYFSQISEKNLIRLSDVLRIYFPEESEELEPAMKLLYRR